MKAVYKYKNNYQKECFFCEEIEAFDINSHNLNIHDKYIIREYLTDNLPIKHTFYFNRFLNENKDNVRYVRHLFICIDENNREYRYAIYYVNPYYKRELRKYPNCIYKNYPNDFIKDFNKGG